MSQLICSKALEHFTGIAASKEGVKGARDHALIVGKYRKVRRIKWGENLNEQKTKTNGKSRRNSNKMC